MQGLARRMRVVLADDRADLTESLASLLAPGFDVVATVHDGQALVRVALAERPDLVVTDIAMPGLRGLEVIGQVKARVPGVRVVCFTSDEDRDTVAEALRLGADGYVVKSAGIDGLLQAMSDIIEGTRRVTWS